jgi:hypothetical protein
VVSLGSPIRGANRFHFAPAASDCAVPNCPGLTVRFSGPKLLRRYQDGWQCPWFDVSIGFDFGLDS